MANNKKSKKGFLKAGLIVLALTVVGFAIPSFMGLVSLARDIVVTGVMAETAIVCSGITNAIISSVKNKNASQNQQNSSSRNRILGRNQEQVYSLGDEQINEEQVINNSYVPTQNQNNTSNRNNQR